MTEPATLGQDFNDVTSPADVGRLQVGQWAIDANGTKLCLVDTHLGFPQRMWMLPGRGHAAIDRAAYPLRLADFKGDCSHPWSHNECGHCYRCGHVIAEPEPRQMQIIAAFQIPGLTELWEEHTLGRNRRHDGPRTGS